MKIAWCMPVDERSAIGRFGWAITAELARRGHDVTILASDIERPAVASPSRIGFQHIESGCAGAYNESFDVVFYNIGDHFGFHGRILDIVDAVPGIGIFHDASIFNFFLGGSRHAGLSAEAEERLVLKHCGSTGTQRFQQRAGDSDWFGLCAELPMVEWIAERMWGAIAHAGHYIGPISAACPGPTTKITLAYRPAVMPNPPAAAKHDPGEIVITTIGRVNANKCYVEVIEAIAASATLRPSAVYRIFGDSQPPDRARLTALASARGVRVEFAETRDDAALARCLESTDIVCALRRPILEGASGSAIEGLLSGRPVIVADAGFYAELPDRYAVKVPAEVPVPALTAALERLAADPDGRHAQGIAARDWALETFSPARYCDALEVFMAAYIEAKPLLRLGADIGRNLANFGFKREDPAIATIAAAAHGLFVGGKA